MRNKIILITGSTAGIGRATAEALAKQGHTIVISGRNPQKTAQVAEEIRKQTGNPNIDYLIADLASLDAVREMAAAFLKRYDHLDVLVNNAGLVSQKRQISRDGYEMQFAVNHLAAFLLTNLLLDALKRSPAARIVNVSSIGHAQGQIHFDDLQFEGEYQPRQAYYQTKLSNVLFTYALARRLKNTRVTANVLHPGIVKTTLSHDYMGNPVFRFLEGLIAVSPEKGAQTSIYLAASPEVEGVTGGYFIRKQQKRSAPHTFDEALQDRLWSVSEALVGLTAAKAVSA
jgi:NAD(P)-dependent dehydrogenase (short-subunit alcohol dehydrogenase family)